MGMFYVYIAGIIVCIACSAFFSASEMSYSACSKVRLEHQRDNGDRKAARAVRIRRASTLCSQPFSWGTIWSI